MGLKRLDTPCGRCGWRYEGFHICFDASKPCPGEGIVDPRDVKTPAKTGPKTAAGLAVISQTATERWERYREENRPRDEQILSLYKEGYGLRPIAEKLGISHATTVKVIKAEEVRTGETIMRPRGRNYRHTKEEVHGGFN